MKGFLATAIREGGVRALIAYKGKTAAASNSTDLKLWVEAQKEAAMQVIVFGDTLCTTITP